VLSPYKSIERPRPCAHTDKEKQAHRHRKVRPRVAYHEPKALVSAEQFWDLGRRDGRQDYDQEWNAGELREQADQDQQAASDFEGSYEMSRQVGVWESNLCEAQNAHVRVNVFEDALRQKD
jgi:hypothetical protein